MWDKKNLTLFFSSEKSKDLYHCLTKLIIAKIWKIFASGVLWGDIRQNYMGQKNIWHFFFQVKKSKDLYYCLTKLTIAKNWKIFASSISLDTLRQYYMGQKKNLTLFSQVRKKVKNFTTAWPSSLLQKFENYLLLVYHWTL